MIEELIKSIQTAIELKKCRHCGCMRETIEGICERLEGTADAQFYPLFCEAKTASERLEEVEYT